MNNPPPKLSFACPVPWQGMSGTERWKYCAQCGHHVANLSALTAAERQALLECAREARVCGTYYLRMSGEMVTPEAPLTPGEWGRLRQYGVAALSAAALTLAAGCVVPAKPVAAESAPPPPVAMTPVEPGPPETKPAQTEEDEVVLLFMGIVSESDEDPENQGYRTKSIGMP